MHLNPQPNKNELLNAVARPCGVDWVNQNTAILVAHGIGNQLPLETLDQFGRGLIKQYKKEFDDEFIISHQIVSKQGDSGVWFDNVLRMQKAGSPYFIDLYEYYWANYAQDKASIKDLNTWLQGVVKGATNFYKKNALIGKQYKDKSPFFDSRTGNFKSARYWFFIAVVSKIFLVIDALWGLIIWLVSMIPLLGKLADYLLQSYADSMVHDLCNVVGEVAIYNVFDPKSKFYDTRRKILDGAVNALKYLIELPVDNQIDINGLLAKAAADKHGKPLAECEKIDNELKKELGKTELFYPSVIVAGHSLGSEVCYDAINKLNLLINEGKISTYDRKGFCRLKAGNPVKDQLRGFITFGCPLDKTVFFLRENVPDNEYLRQQFLDNYHGFKQRSLDLNNNSNTNKAYLHASCDLKKLLNDILWRNYYDHKDYVSGGLDYYTGLTNVDCQFKAGKFGFTHSYYWDCDNFYIDIICNFLCTD
jgi:hypothetical protein